MHKNHHYIAIETERHKFTPLFDLGQGRVTRSLRLTTMVDRQRRAIISVYLYSADKRILLKQYDLKQLPPKKAGPPRFIIKGSFDGSFELELSLQVDGRHYDTSTVSLKRHIKKRSLLPLIILFLILAAAGAIVLIPRNCGAGRADSSTPATGSSARTGTIEQERPAAEERAAPSPTGKQTTDQEAGHTSQKKNEGTSGSAEQDAVKGKTPLEPDRTLEEEAQEAASDSGAAPASEAGSSPGTDPGEASSDTTPAADIIAEEPPEPLYLDAKRELVVYFGPNQDSLSREAEQQLRTLAGELRSWRNLSITIEGHCALFGTEEGREELSLDRAEAGASLLRKILGPGEADISLSGRAGQQPVTRDRERQELNRRIELSVKGKAPERE